jgi:hypothetical protein
MRTTVAIDDHLLARAKDRARERGTTLGKVIEDALRTELNGSAAPAAVAPPIPVFAGDGTGPGIHLVSTRDLLDLLDEGVARDQLR